METIWKVYPDAFVALDPAAWAVGYGKPWQVWSTQDDDMKCLGEGKTREAAIHDALNNLEE